MTTEFITMRTPEAFNQAGARKLPGHLGIIITEVSAARVTGELPVVEAVMAPNQGRPSPTRTPSSFMRPVGRG